MTACVIGIDPGLTGAWALVQGDMLMHVGDMPVTKDKSANIIHTEIWLMQLAKLMEWGAEGVVIERVGAGRAEGAAAAFKYGQAVGTINACVIATRLPMIKLTPVAWKRALGLQGQGKKASLAMARGIWPDNLALRLEKHHNRAEAALLAWGAVHGKFNHIMPDQTTGKKPWLTTT